MGHATAGLLAGRAEFMQLFKETLLIHTVHDVINDELLISVGCFSYPLAWLPLQRISACGPGAEITSCCWAVDSDHHWRLFASLIDGSLVEVSWRLGNHTPTDSFGGTVWSMSAKPQAVSEAGGFRACSCMFGRPACPD